MSDTVKLIIEIPKSAMELLNTTGVDWLGAEHILSAVAHGIPLDDDSERAEVKAYFDGEAYGWEQGRKALIDDLKAEIEEYISTIDRAISEDELKIEGMKEAYTDCLKILDNIGKESED